MSIGEAGGMLFLILFAVFLSAVFLAWLSFRNYKGES